MMVLFLSLKNTNSVSIISFPPFPPLNRPNLFDVKKRERRVKMLKQNISFYNNSRE